MTIVFSPHALEEILDRNLDLELLRQAAQNPEQVVPERRGRLCCQKRFEGPDGKPYLIRVIIEDVSDDRRVITAYLTSRVKKYWRPT